MFGVIKSSRKFRAQRLIYGAAPGCSSFPVRVQHNVKQTRAKTDKHNTEEDKFEKSHKCYFHKHQMPNCESSKCLFNSTMNGTANGGCTALENNQGSLSPSAVRSVLLRLDALEKEKAGKAEKLDYFEMELDMWLRATVLNKAAGDPEMLTTLKILNPSAKSELDRYLPFIDGYCVFGHMGDWYSPEYRSLYDANFTAFETHVKESLGLSVKDILYEVHTSNLAYHPLDPQHNRTAADVLRKLHVFLQRSCHIHHWPDLDKDLAVREHKVKALRNYYDMMRIQPVEVLRSTYHVGDARND